MFTPAIACARPATLFAHPLAKQAQLVSVSHIQRHRPAAAAGGDGSEPQAANQEDLQRLASELIAADPDAMQRIVRVTAAVARVQELQAEQARLASAIAAETAGSDAVLAERRATLEASSMVAEAEVKAAELLLQAAQLEAEQAEAERLRVAAAAEQASERSRRRVPLFAMHAGSQPPPCLCPIA